MVPRIANLLISDQRNQRKILRDRVTQHDRLPSLLGDGDNGTEIVYCEEKHILYWAD